MLVFECVVVGLERDVSSLFMDLPCSRLGAMEGLDLVVASDVLDAFIETLLDNVALELLESREGGNGSGNVAVEGDCNLDDGTETTTGEDTEVPPGLCEDMPGTVVAVLRAPAKVASAGSGAASFAPPTEALKRLYKPLSPPGISSIPRGSLTEEGAGATVKSSNVVRVSERDAVACI
jgi:hypothetical protein